MLVSPTIDDATCHHQPVINKYRLRRLREEAGLTQGQLAKAAGITRQTISRWESGQRGENPHYDTLRRVAKALGTTPRYLTSKGT